MIYKGFLVFLQAKHWLEFASGFQEGDGWSKKLKTLDDHLVKQSVILGYGMTISPVDVTVFAAVRDTVVMSEEQMKQKK